MAEAKETDAVRLVDFAGGLPGRTERKIEKAVAAERERCAKIAERWSKRCADRIRGKQT